MPTRRLEALCQLSEAGLNTYDMVGPVLPMLSENDLNELVNAIAKTGTKRLMVDRMRYRPGMEATISRLPLIVTDPFRARYQEALADRDRAQSMERSLARACRELSLNFEQAFRS